MKVKPKVTAIALALTLPFLLATRSAATDLDQEYEDLEAQFWPGCFQEHIAEAGLSGATLDAAKKCLEERIGPDPKKLVTPQDQTTLRDDSQESLKAVFWARCFEEHIEKVEVLASATLDNAKECLKERIKAASLVP